MSDLVERLRQTPCDIGGDHPDLHEQAANEIERLQDRNEVLKKSAEINRRIMDSYGPRFDEYDKKIERLQKRNALLEYVAVAADVIMRNYDDQTTSVITWDALSFALDKLREVSDD